MSVMKMKIITRMEKIVGSLKHLPWTLPWLNAFTSWRNIEEDEERAVLLSTICDPLPVLLRTLFGPMVHPSISSNSSVFNRWKFPTLEKVIHPSETLVGWRYFLIFPSGPSFFLRNCHAGKGREGAGVHFPPGQQINSKKISHKWALQ